MLPTYLCIQPRIVIFQPKIRLIENVTLVNELHVDLFNHFPQPKCRALPNVGSSRRSVDRPDVEVLVVGVLEKGPNVFGQTELFDPSEVLKGFGAN